jgi:hypothetical protein
LATVANRNELVNSKKAEEFYAIVPDKKKVIKLPRIKKDKVRPVPGCRPVVGLPLLGVVRHLLEFGRRGVFQTMRCIVAAACVWLTVSSHTGRGEVVSFNFAGEVISRQDDTGLLGGGFEAGSRFAGVVSYDTADAGADWFPDNSHWGLYSFDSSFNDSQDSRWRLLGLLGGYAFR